MRLSIKGKLPVKHKRNLEKDTTYLDLHGKTPEEIDEYVEEHVKSITDMKVIIKLLLKQHLSQQL